MPPAKLPPKRSRLARKVATRSRIRTPSFGVRPALCGADGTAPLPTPSSVIGKTRATATAPLHEVKAKRKKSPSHPTRSAQPFAGATPKTRMGAEPRGLMSEGPPRAHGGSHSNRPRTARACRSQRGAKTKSAPILTSPTARCGQSDGGRPSGNAAWTTVARKRRHWADCTRGGPQESSRGAPHRATLAPERARPVADNRPGQARGPLPSAALTARPNCRLAGRGQRRTRCLACAAAPRRSGPRRGLPLSATSPASRRRNRARQR